MRLRLAILWLCLAVSFTARSALADLSVVASIAPVHSLVSQVLGDAGTAHLVVSGGQSPHDYVLKPSDARSIEHADLVFMIAETIEPFLVPALRGDDPRRGVVRLGSAPGVERLPPREGAIWEPEREPHRHGGGGLSERLPAGHGHKDPDFDPHLWLDPRNAAAMVSAIEAELVARDPERAARYRANAAAAREDLARLENEIGALLEPVRTKPYLVFHDAYQYFERRFALSPAGAIAIVSAVRPSAKRIALLKERMRRGGVVCVFREPQFASGLIDVIVEGTAARQGVLDPIGATIPPGPGAYRSLLLGIAGAMRACLEG